MNAVDSEHKKNIMNDDWRRHQLLKSTSKEGHDFNSFSTGNLNTLNVPTIRDDLLTFYKKFYSANIMKLVVYGKEDLETLEKWTVKMFSDVKNIDVEVPIMKEIPFDKENLGLLFKVVPIEDADYLAFEWYIENVRPYYKENPTQYITSLIGHEGKNSLLSYLKDEGLALELSASEYIHANLFTEINITIKLTKKGLAEYERVSRIVCQYIKTLKEKGVDKGLWEEIRKVNKMKFDFKDKEKPMSYVNQLSIDLHYYPVEDVIRRKYMMEEFNADNIKALINKLSADTLRIYLSSKSVENECIKTEKWYGTKYIDTLFTKEFLEMYENPQVGSSVNGLVLDLPPKNNFIPQNFYIFAKDISVLPKLPEKIFTTERIDFFFKQDNTFKNPKISANFLIYTNDCGFGFQLEANLLFQIWRRLLDESLRELKYEAQTAAFNIQIHDEVEGLEIKISGFNDTINTLILAIFEKINTFDLTAYKSHFDDVKLDIIKENENFNTKIPYQQAFHVNDIILQTSPLDCHMDQLNSALKKITFERLLAFHKEFLLTTRVDALLLGNIDKDSAIHIAKGIEDILSSKKGCSPLSKDQIPENRIINVPQDTNWFYDHNLKPTEDGNKEPNSCILSCFQYGEAEPRTRMLFEVLQNYLSEPCFEQLRTNEQLGYIAFSY